MFFLTPFLFSLLSSPLLWRFWSPVLGVWLGMYEEATSWEDDLDVLDLQRNHGFLSLHNNSMRIYFKINNQQSLPVGMSHSECTSHFDAWIIYSSSPQLLYLVEQSIESALWHHCPFLFLLLFPRAFSSFPILHFSYFLYVCWRPCMEARVQSSGVNSLLP